MQFEVPQFIDVEDKIFGPLTWKQFIYLGGGIGLGVATFLINIFLFLLIGLPILILSAVLVFYPVNNRPFSFFLQAVFTYLTNTKLYIWKQEKEIIHKSPFTPSHIPEDVPIQPAIGGRGKNLGSLARRLEMEALQKK